MGHCLNHTCKNGEQCVSLRNSSACLQSGLLLKHDLCKFTISSKCESRKNKKTYINFSYMSYVNFRLST